MKNIHNYTIEHSNVKLQSNKRLKTVEVKYTVHKLFTILNKLFKHTIARAANQYVFFSLPSGTVHKSQPIAGQIAAPVDIHWFVVLVTSFPGIAAFMTRIL